MKLSSEIIDKCLKDFKYELTKEQLEDLIERMCVEEKYVSSDESIRWNACREAEKVSGNRADQR